MRQSRYFPAETFICLIADARRDAKSCVSTKRQITFITKCSLIRSFTHSLIIVCALACNPERVKYTPELKRDMAETKIKRITSADQMTTVDEYGTKIAAAVQRELTARLTTAKTPADKAGLCHLQNLPRTKAIADKYAVDIRLLGAADIKNPRLAPKEREVLDAYLYNAEKKLPQTPNVQRIGDTLLVYNTAVPADSPICEACFPGQNPPFAVWRLVFSKRELVRRMVDSKK